MVRLTKNMVELRTKQSDMSSVKQLQCWGQQLDNVSIVREMCNVEILGLSLNEITSLQPFKECKKLRELYLRNNKIKSLEELRYIKSLPVLECLWLEGNPCCDTAERDYRSIVLRMIPKLKKLDNIYVSEREVEEAIRKIDEQKHALPQQEDHSDEKDQHCQEQPVKQSYPPCLAPLNESKSMSDMTNSSRFIEMHEDVLPAVAARLSGGSEHPGPSIGRTDLLDELHPAVASRFIEIHEHPGPSSRHTEEQYPCSSSATSNTHECYQPRNSYGGAQKGCLSNVMEERKRVDRLNSVMTIVDEMDDYVSLKVLEKHVHERIRKYFDQ